MSSRIDLAPGMLYVPRPEAPSLGEGGSYCLWKKDMLFYLFN